MLSTFIACFSYFQIDAEILPSLDDETLSKYVPLLGDRVAVRSYIQMRTKEKIKQGSRRKNLFGILKEKLRRGDHKNVADSGDEATTSKAPALAPRRSGRKATRRVDLGWIHNKVQVRKRKGGGVRNITVSRTATKADLIRKGKDLFFPDGVSTKGPEKMFSFDLLDFKETPLPEGVSVGDCYDLMQMGIITFYISTVSAAVGVGDVTETVSAAVDAGGDVTETVSAVVDVGDATESALEPIAINVATSNTAFNLDHISPSIQILSPNFNPSLPVFLDATDPDNAGLVQVLEPANNTLSDTISIGHANSSTMSITIQDDASFEDAGIECNSAAPHGSTDDRGTNESNGFEMSNERPSHDCVTHETPITVESITINRVNVLNELISVFKTPGILQAKLSFRLTNENGVDAEGVSRDIYSAFWKEFFLSRARGEYECVPAHMETYAETEWIAIGAILLKGFKDVGYFPLKLAKAFVVALLFGKDCVSSDILWNSFLRYVTTVEKESVGRILLSEGEEEDADVLSDLLSRMDSHTIPRNNSPQLKELLLGVAHKEIIQDSKFAMDEMARSSRSGLLELLPNLDSVLAVYEAKKPTPKRVIALLHVEDEQLGMKRDKIVGYLRLFIRSLDERQLEKFLRFVTGSDVICVNHISVVFSTPTSEYSRTPVAHTCGPTLEIPDTYCSAQQMKADFTNILESNYLSMDIA